MKALLLIGGQATRLQPLTRLRPKSLLPLCDREVLHYQITQIAMAGIREIVLAAGVHVDQLSAYVSRYSGGLSFLVSEEEQPLGTAGAIGHAARLLDGEPVLVLNADIISSLKLKDVIDEHLARRRAATIVGYAVANPLRYGLLDVNGDALSAFREKPAAVAGPGPHYINAGIYVLEAEAYNSIPGGRKVSIERETFPALIEKHGALTHFPLNGLWMDIGTFESYFQANFTLLARRYAQGEDWLWGERSDAALFKDLIYINKAAQLGKHVDLFHRVILMAGASVSEGCRLRNCLVLPGARIGAGSQLTDCVIGPGAAVADNSRLNNLLLVAGEQNTPFYPHAVEA